MLDSLSYDVVVSYEKLRSKRRRRRRPALSCTSDRQGNRPQR
jgi:hypothetical protein